MTGVQTCALPIFFGNSLGVKDGGVLRRNNRKLRIKALPVDLPDFIEIDIEPLKIGDKVYVGDLLNENYTFLHSENTVVCQIKTARLAIVDEVEEDEEGIEGEEGAEGTEGTEGTGETTSEGAKTEAATTATTSTETPKKNKKN